MKVRGKWAYLYWALDKEGNTIDFYLSPTRNAKAAGRFLAKALADRRAPFFAGAKLPSKNVSSHFSRPLPSSAPSSACQASSQTSCSSHCFNCRQQVAGEGYESGTEPPCRFRLKHPQDAFQAGSVRGPGPAPAIFTTLRLRQQWRHKLPLRIRQQLKSLPAHSRSRANTQPAEKNQARHTTPFIQHALRSGRPKRLPGSPGEVSRRGGSLVSLLQCQEVGDHA